MTLSCNRVCVFCGSALGGSDSYQRAAVEMGQALGRAGLDLVYGGANLGLMGALATAALDAGAQVTGVLPRVLIEREVPRSDLTELLLVETMGERKDRMVELAGGFVALPGGGGTLDELFEVFTTKALGLHEKPIVLFQVDGYFDRMLEFLAHAKREGFIRPEQLTLLRVGHSADEVIAELRRE